MVALDFKRPFNWGILIVSDAGASMPEFDDTDARVLARSESVLVLRVRHAQDRDHETVDAGGYLQPFEVGVEVSLGRADRPVAVEHVLAISSGHVLIGDADSEEQMAVPPGSYRLAADLDDPEFAALVRLWFERLDE